jgi:hypothetical protein
MVADPGEGRNMNDWQSTCLGRRSLPRDLSDFEIEAFFTFSEAERRVIEVSEEDSCKKVPQLWITHWG